MTIKLFDPDDKLIHVWENKPIQALKSHTVIFGATEAQTFRMFDTITFIIVERTRTIIGYSNHLHLIIYN